MGQNNNKSNCILELFYEYPNKSFTIREITKKTKIPKSTVHKYLEELKKSGLITKNNQSSDSILFKTKKTNFYIEKLIESGLIEFIKSELNPDVIILFGSIRKGESDFDSDFDIFIESSVKKELKILKYEKKLKHSIQLFIESDIFNLPDRLLNNIVNGIKIIGYIKIK